MPRSLVANDLQQELAGRTAGAAAHALPADGRAPQSAALLSELVSLGVRMTSQRRLIVALIQDARVPLDAATLLEMARKHDSSVDQATVYRTLALLRKRGLMGPPNGTENPRAAGERQSHGPNRDHYRLTCVHCGAAEQSSSRGLGRLKEFINAQHGFEIGIVSLEVRGLCRACSRASAGQASRASKSPHRRKRRK